MGARVKAGVGTVYVTDEAGERHAFTAGAGVPDWAASRMVDVIESGDPQPAAEADEPKADAKADRPKGNASREAWAEYARAQGFEVADDAGRDDIIAAVDRD